MEFHLIPISKLLISPHHKYIYTMLRLSQRHYYELAVVVFILLIPFVAMRFTEEVRWSLLDFLVAGGLLVVLCVGIELVLKYVAQPRQRLWAGLAVVAVFLLLWAELAVGIFGTPLAGS